MASVWHQDTKKISFKELDKSIKTDVLIIGGGIAGIMCAYALQERGVDYVLVEAREICSGITKNTTAKVTSQHGLVYDKLISGAGIEKARMYLDANESALDKIRTLSETVDCDFEEKDSFVYSLTDEKKIRDEVEAVKKLGHDAEFVSSLPLPFKTAGAVKFKNQGQFNPLKFLYGVAENLNIYENTRVRGLLPDSVIAGKGEIKADKIICATHFPFINKHGLYPMKMYQSRSYVIAVENAQDVDGMYVDEAMKGMSFRNYKNYLLIGGGDHRTGKDGGKWQELRDFAKKNYPDSKEKYAWATQDCMTLDSVPYIGLYSKNTPNFYVTTGFNKWGMTTSLAAAEILADMVTGRQNKNASVLRRRGVC